jgi:hypothetical protein
MNLWDLPWANLADAGLTACRVATVCVLAVMCLQQRRRTRRTIAQLDTLLAGVGAASSKARAQKPGHHVIKLDEWR